jgi:hypothetical protein
MIIKFFKNLATIFDRSNDPVHSCEVYKDKANGSCVHVDGPLCDFPDCSMLRAYQEKRNDYV